MKNIVKNINKLGNKSLSAVNILILLIIRKGKLFEGEKFGYACF